MNTTYERLISLLDERSPGTEQRRQSVHLRGSPRRKSPCTAAWPRLTKRPSYSGLRLRTHSDSEAAVPAIAETVARANYACAGNSSWISTRRSAISGQPSPDGRTRGDGVIDRLITRDDGHAG